MPRKKGKKEPPTNYVGLAVLKELEIVNGFRKQVTNQSYPPSTSEQREAHDHLIDLVRNEGRPSEVLQRLANSGAIKNMLRLGRGTFQVPYSKKLAAGTQEDLQKLREAWEGQVVIPPLKIEQMPRGHGQQGYATISLIADLRLGREFPSRK